MAEIHTYVQLWMVRLLEVVHNNYTTEPCTITNKQISKQTNK